MKIRCPECGRETIFRPENYRCDCGGAWEPLETRSFKVEEIDRAESSLWRYLRIFNLKNIKSPIGLGAGWTPLLDAEIMQTKVLVKMEFIAPTGSFKDRGTEVEMNFLRACGVNDVAEDSSGNAGASAAAYAARLGLKAAIYTPADASPVKLEQISIFGAELHRIPGARSEATRAVMKAVENGAVYASHAYNPLYLLGQQSFAWEIWEQLEGHAPDAIVIPVGQGGLLLGAWLGFRRLLAAGLIAKLPRLFAVQPKRLAPIAEAFARSDADIPEKKIGEKSIAEGLAITRPVRAKRIMQALYESQGAGLIVEEEEILPARDELAKNGFFVEPSSAVASAALSQVITYCGQDTQVVIALTGSGLKSV